jgi:DNA-binding transcriptional ArsR family regulator
MATVIPGTPAQARHQRTPAQLLETIRDRGGVTRADLSRLTGLSRSAVAHAAAVLLAEGLITEREPGPLRRCRC